MKGKSSFIHAPPQPVQQPGVAARSAAKDAQISSAVPGTLKEDLSSLEAGGAQRGAELCQQDGVLLQISPWAG